MKRLLLLILLFTPSLALAEVKGIKFVHKHPAALDPLRVPQWSEIWVGEKYVAVGGSRLNRINLFDLDGTLVREFDQPFGVASAVWCGDQLYATSANKGLVMLDEDGSVESVGDVGEVDKVTATPDGKTVFAMNCKFPTLWVLDRDPKTGKLTKTGQVFQADDAALAQFFEIYRRRGIPVPLVKGAERLAKFSTPSDMKVSADGKSLFVSVSEQGVVSFGKDAKGWKLLEALQDNQGGAHTLGLHGSMTVEPVGDNLFVGGVTRLSWFKVDGEKLSHKKFWADDLDKSGGGRYAVLPFIDLVISLEASKNGKYLFVCGQDDGGFTVCKIGDDDLELVGKVNDSPAGTKMLEVALSQDGKRLYAKTNNCQLLAYDLDETFTK